MRILYSGAAPLEADFVATIHTCLQNMVADVVLSQGASTSITFTSSFFYITLAYGLAEISSMIAILHPDDANMHIRFCRACPSQS